MKRKYHLYSLGVVVAGLFLIVTEVSDRWLALGEDYQMLKDKQSKVMDPASAQMRKKELLAELAGLQEDLKRNAGNTEQSETGLLELIDNCAKANGIRVEAIAPQRSGTGSDSTTAHFSLEASGAYHRLATFLNALETGPIAVRVTGMDLTESQERGKALTLRIDASATFVRENP